MDLHARELHERDCRLWREIRVKVIMSYKCYVEHYPFCGIFDMHDVWEVVFTSVFR
jgi:hypothetical protein